MLAVHSLPRDRAYPLQAPTLPMLRMEDILERHRNRIDQVVSLVATEDPEREDALRITLRRVAAWMHLLPASESHHHAYEGGLLEHSLEVALWSAQAAQGRLGDLRQSGWERRQEESAFTLATLLAGLCHDLGKPVSDLKITSLESGEAWIPYRESLLDWGERTQTANYQLHWLRGRSDRHRGFSLMMLREIIDARLLEALRAIGPHLEASLMRALFTPAEDDDPIVQWVSGADAESAARSMRDPRRQLLGMGALSPEAFFVAALRDLLTSGSWTINRLGSPLWLIDERLYLAWPQAAHDLRRLLERDRIHGIPFDEELMALFLLDRGLLIPDPEHPDSPTLQIHPESLSFPIRVLELRNPRRLFDGLIPQGESGTRVDESHRLPTPPFTESTQEIPADDCSDPTTVDVTADTAVNTQTVDLFETLIRHSDEMGWQLRGSELFLPHPETAHRLHLDPLAFITQLDERGWLEAGSHKALRKVRVVDSKRGLLLNADITTALVPRLKVPKRVSQRKRLP